MKILVISDIHGSSYYAKKIEEIEKYENPDKIILLGDLYYHGPRNELSQEYAPMKVAEVLNKLKEKILAVRGNCDAEVDEMISEFPFQEYVKMNIEGKEYFFTHGHKYNNSNLPNEYIDVLMYGHLHTGFITKEDGIVIANPGSISLPKENTAHSYIIIDNNKIILKDIDSNTIKEINV